MTLCWCYHCGQTVPKATLSFSPTSTNQIEYSLRKEQQDWHIRSHTSCCRRSCFSSLISSSPSVSYCPACLRAEKGAGGGEQGIRFHTGRGISTCGLPARTRWCTEVEGRDHPSPLVVQEDGGGARNCIICLMLHLSPTWQNSP